MWRRVPLLHELRRLLEELKELETLLSELPAVSRDRLWLEHEISRVDGDLRRVLAESGLLTQARELDREIDDVLDEGREA